MSSIRERLLGTTNDSSTSNTSIRDRLELNSSYYKNEYKNEINKRNQLQKNIQKSTYEKGVQTTVTPFSTQRNILPIQEQSEITKSKKFEITAGQDKLKQNKDVEKKYQDIQQTNEYKKQMKELEEQSNKVGYAKYEYDKQRVAEDNIGWYDKSIGRLVDGFGDLLDYNGGLIKNENGDLEYLPTFNQMKNEKVRNEYDTAIGRFAGDVLYESGKIAGSTLVNKVLPGVGSTMYFGKMFVDSTNQAISEGYDSGSATIYGLVNVGLEYGVGKALGSATKGLTGGKTNDYEALLNKTFSKVIKNPKIANILANAGSEATEEFIQEYLDNINKLAILDRNTDAKDYLSIFANEDILADALYSAAIGGVTGGTIGTLSGADTNVDNNDVNLYDTFKKELEETKKNTTSKETINKIDTIISNIESSINNNSNVDTIISQINEYETLKEQNKITKEQEIELNNLKEQLNTIQNQNIDTNINSSVRENLPTVQDIVNQEKTKISNINMPIVNNNTQTNFSGSILPTANDFNTPNINIPNNGIKVDIAKIKPEILEDIKGFKLGDTSVEGYKGSYIKTMLNEVGIKVPTAMNYVSEVRPDMSFTTTKDLTRQQYSSISNALQKLKSIDVTSVNNANYSIPIGNYQFIRSNNSNINELRRSASMYLNNTAKTNNTIRLLENIIKDRNYIIRFNPNITNEQGVPVNGLITKENGKTIIELNPNADNYVEFLVIHEITHDIATKEMKELILDYAKQDTEFEKSLESLKERYKTNDVSDEVVADVCGELFGNREFIQSVVEKKPNIFKKILNNIRKLAEKIKGTGANEYVGFVENLKEMWEEAYYSNRSNIKNKMFSIQQDSNGNKFVNVDTDQDIFDGVDEKDYNKIAKMYITDYLIGNTRLGNNDSVEINKKTSKKYTNPGKKQENFVEKMKLTPELKNVLGIATLRENSIAKKTNSKFANWEYYDFEFKLDGKTFKGNINVGITDKGKYLYEINNVKKTSGITGTSLHRPTGFSANNIPQSNNNVNSNISSTTKYSMQNNENNTQRTENSSFSLEQRVSGDKLLDTQDLIEEIKLVGAKVDKNGYVTLYHQTTNESADKIRQTGKMFAKEPYVYFSTSKNASQSEGRGSTKLEFKIPAEKLILDDIFEDNADVKIKLDSSKELDISNYIVNENNDLNKYIFDNAFYDQFKYEDKTKITKTISELKSEKEKLAPDNNEDDWVKNYHLNTKIKALENGYNSEYDYLVGREKERLIKDYEFGKLTKQIEKKKKLEAKKNQLQQDIKESTPFKNAQYKIIQETNPMFDEEHVGIRSPKDIKTFEEVINDEDSFTWGDYSKEDAIRDLKKGTVTIYSSYPIKNGTFVSTSYQQALDYAGGDPTQVHSRKASLNSVAWINGDEGQYAKVYDILPTKYSQNTKEWNDYLKENFPSAGTKTEMSEIKLPVREDVESVRKNNELDYIPQNPTKESTYKESEKLAEILKEKPKTVEENDSWLKKLATIKFVDKGYYVDKLARKVNNKELSSKYDYSLLSNGIANQIIGNGRMDENGNKIGKGLYEIFEPIENSGLLDDFSSYIYHKHNIDRMSLQNRFNEANKAIFGDGMTSEMSEKIVKEYETKYPEFESWADDIYEYNNANLEMFVKYGVLSKDSMDYYNKKYPHYVPTIREQAKTKTQMDFLLGKKASVNNPIKKAKGGNGNIIPLKDAMALRTMQTVNSSLRNNFGLELLNSVETEQIRNKENVENIVEEINSDELLTKGNENSPATLTVFDKGEKVTFEISDEIYEALKPSNIKTFKFLNKLNNIRRGLLTEYNPTFMITNPLKDIQDGSINSKHPKLFAKNLIEAVKQIKNDGQYKQLYIANGGSYETYFNYNNGTNIAPSKLDKIAPLKKISEINEVIEMAPRLAEFISSIEAGDSIETAMYNASEITTNFKRGGDMTKTLDRNGVTFLNAGVQGTVKQIRNVQEARVEGIKGITKLAVRWTTAGLLPTLLMNMVWGDDDDYDELSDYVKNNYYIIGKYDDGEFIRIPKGRVVSVLQSFFQNVLNGIEGKEIDLDGFVDLIENNLLPSDPNESSLIAPIKQAINNETWYGGDLVPTRLQNLPDAEQYDETTDSISIWLGKQLNISPYKINYVLDQYSGAIGDYILPYLTQEAESGSDSFTGKIIAPVKDKFTVDSTLKNQNISEFYSLSEELTKKSNSSNATDEDVLKNKYINSIKSDISKLYAEKREIQSSSSLKDSEKYNQSKELQKQINELSKTALNNYENIEVTDNYAIIGDKEYYKNSSDEWTKINTDSAKYKIANLITKYSNYLKYDDEIKNIKNQYDNSNTRKNAVIKYVNSLNLTIPQKAMLIKMNYSSYTNYDSQIINYINSQEISIDEKTEILEELGFKVRNGKVYKK